MEDKNVKYDIQEIGATPTNSTTAANYTKPEPVIEAKLIDEPIQTSPLDVKWPRLEVGQLVEIEGAPFRVARLNASTVVLRPESGKYSARNIMDKIRRGK